MKTRYLYFYVIENHGDKKAASVLKIAKGYNLVGILDGYEFAEYCSNRNSAEQKAQKSNEYFKQVGVLWNGKTEEKEA